MSASPPTATHDPALVWAGAADGESRRLAGRRAAVHASGLDGLVRIAADGRTLAGRVRLHGARAATMVVGTQWLRRELIVGGASVQESVAVPERLPGVVVRWLRTGGAPEPTSLHVEVELPPGAVSSTDGGVDVRDPDGRGCRIRVDGKATWRIDAEEGGGRLHVEARLTTGAPTLSMQVAAHGGRADPSPAALGGLDAHVRRMDAALASPGLTLATGVRELDEGVAWARALVRGASGPLDMGDASSPLPEPHAWSALAGLALGEWDAALRVLDALAPGPVALVALAEWVAWTGDAGPLLARRGEVERWAATTAAEPWVGARLADAAEASGDADWASRLRDAGSGGGVRLPTVGPRASPPLARVLGSAHDAGPTLRSRDDAIPAPLVARHTFAEGRPDEAAALLREHLGGPVRHGPPADPLLPAVAGWTLVTGLLGAAPDAAFGRLALSPALPAHWTAFAFDGLRIGDARVAGRYRRDGASHEWVFRPQAGALPPTLVLRPSFAGRVERVELDGTPADVDVAWRDGRSTVTLQLPLDSERRLSVVGS